eukprot:g4190.t1
MPRKTKASRKRKARISATDAQIEAAQKRLRVQGKRDDELFVVDSAGERAAGAGAKRARVEERQRRAKVAAEAAEQALLGGSVVAAGGVPVLDVPLVDFEEAPTRARGPAAARNLRALGQSRRMAPDRHLQGPLVSGENGEGSDAFDLWGDAGTPAAGASAPSYETQGFKAKTSEWHEDILQRRKRSVRGNKQRGSTVARLRAADVVPSGASYNPELRAHAHLVEQAAASELMQRRRQAQLYDQLYPDAPPTDQTLVASDDDEDGEENPEESAAMAARRAVKNKKMTRAQRNAQSRHKAKMLEQAAKKKAKQLNSQLAHIKEIKNDISAEERQKQENKARVDAWRKEREQSEAPLKRGGKLTHHQPKIEVLDAAELPGNMRNIKPVGNAVRDRMHNMMRRNVMEVGRKQRRKKRKVKKLERDRNWQLHVPDDSEDEEHDRLTTADWKAVRRP